MAINDAPAATRKTQRMPATPAKPPMNGPIAIAIVLAP
jgi:hypothetical protein